MSLLRKARRYLRENWGAPFVIAFMLLLTASAVALSLGLSDAANSVGVYAFYALVVGVVLQIASYIKFGEGTPGEISQPEEVNQPEKVQRKPVSFHWSRRRKVVAISVLAIIVLASVAVVYYPQTYPKLSVTVGFTRGLLEPDNSTVVGFGVAVSGGIPPYSFTASWPDKFSQISAVGLFSRTFSSNQTIPQTVNVSVTSADRQSAEVTINLNSSATR